jgi:acyl-CoA-binding protein
MSPVDTPVDTPVPALAPVEERYGAAVAVSKTLTQKPSNAELLHMYGMFKYVKEGNATGSAPSFIWDANGNYKWHEWKKYDDRDATEVREEYILYIGTLVAKYGVV